MSNDSLKALVTAILADGIVDTDEVDQLRSVMYEDGMIDREEADALFEINDGCSGNDNCDEWTEFFVEAVGDHILKDEETPGVVDDDEGAWLVAKIEGDGQLDDVEQALLDRITEDGSTTYAPLQAMLTTA